MQYLFAMSRCWERGADLLPSLFEAILVRCLQASRSQVSGPVFTGCAVPPPTALILHHRYPRLSGSSLSNGWGKDIRFWLLLACSMIQASTLADTNMESSTPTLKSQVDLSTTRVFILLQRLQMLSIVSTMRMCLGASKESMSFACGTHAHASLCSDGGAIKTSQFTCEID